MQVAGLLKSWLQDLHEPLIRADLYKEILQTQQHEQTSDRLSALQAVLREVGVLSVDASFLTSLLR